MNLTELCGISLCDAVLKGIAAIDDTVTVAVSGASISTVSFGNASVCEFRILGYEVLDENEEVVFDMPDIEIFGDKIQDAINTLMRSDPHVEGFAQKQGNAVLTVCDNTDNYEIEIRFETINVE